MEQDSRQHPEKREEKPIARRTRRDDRCRVLGSGDDSGPPGVDRSFDLDLGDLVAQRRGLGEESRPLGNETVVGRCRPGGRCRQRSDACTQDVELGLDLAELVRERLLGTTEVVDHPLPALCDVQVARGVGHLDRPRRSGASTNDADDARVEHRLRSDIGRATELRSYGGLEGRTVQDLALRLDVSVRRTGRG